jgi:hypothetical protein
MYGYPVSLPAFSNREDFQLPVSIFDDDTGAAFNIASITLANPSGFTGNVWTVTAGTIVTASNTQITIPGYPIGNQLSALALTVGVGLAILPGSPITIADASGLNTMTGYVTSYASATGALVCQIGSTFQFEIRRGRPANSDGYTTWFDFGVQPDRGPLLSASLGGGILITDLGYLQILIAEAQFRQLCEPGTYMASLTMFDGVNTRQVFLASLPVLYGGVTQ